MDKTTHGWKVFDAETPVLIYEYSFGPGTANALAVRGEGGLFVLSPPRKAESGVYADLAPYGRVAALVATNAFHHMGLAEWKETHPDAKVYAPAQSIARVERKTRLTGVRPIAEAAPLAGPRIDLVDLPHYKTGETLVRIRSSRGLAWYVTDWMMNMRELPPNPVAKLVFGLSGSAPGLKFNNLTPLFMVQDKQALKRWLRSEFDRERPQWIIPAHGEIADLREDAGAAGALFGSG